MLEIYQHEPIQDDNSQVEYNFHQIQKILSYVIDFSTEDNKNLFNEDFIYCMECILVLKNRNTLSIERFNKLEEIYHKYVEIYQNKN